MNSTTRIGIAVVWLALLAPLGARAQRGVSPASQRPPATVTPQTYPDELVRSGEVRFVARCGFCHGRDAGGGEGGPDLTRSLVVAADAYGNAIGPFIRSGGVHDIQVLADEIPGIAAFIHTRKAVAEAMLGGRRFVDPEDLRTGDADAGRRYFDGDGGCATCHSPTGDLAGIGTRLEGLDLMRAMLSPRVSQPPEVRVVTASGELVTGRLVRRDEFRIAITDDAGERHEWATDEVGFAIDDPMDAHFEILGRYTDEDMRDVYAYLETLR
jgi:cytochrome c oxidase cbb3-type subunit 3